MDILGSLTKLPESRGEPTFRGFIMLTPVLFRELDFIARTQGGCVIEVMDHKDMGSDFAKVSFMLGDVYIDINKPDGKCSHAATISLSSQVDIGAFHAAPRPELNWMAIAEDQIYRFLIHHEIGHLKLDPPLFDKILRKENGEVDSEGTRKIIFVCELRADRYAWNALFPDKPLPKRKGTEHIVEDLEIFMNEHGHLFSPPRARNALPTDPGQYIPVRHIRKGMLWT